MSRNFSLVSVHSDLWCRLFSTGQNVVTLFFTWSVISWTIQYNLPFHKCVSYVTELTNLDNVYKFHQFSLHKCVFIYCPNTRVVSLFTNWCQIYIKGYLKIKCSTHSLCPVPSVGLHMISATAQLLDSISIVCSYVTVWELQKWHLFYLWDGYLNLAV